MSDLEITKLCAQAMGNSMNRRARTLLASLALLTAEALAGAQPDSPWVVVSGASHHFATDRRFNERNWGLGFERPTSYPRLAAVGGVYDNSFCRRSFYGGVAWTPVAVFGAHLGVMGGAVSGYRPQASDCDAPPLTAADQVKSLLPMIVPTAQVEGKKMGANLFYAPKLKDGAAVLGLQLKVRF